MKEEFPAAVKRDIESDSAPEYLLYLKGKKLKKMSQEKKTSTVEKVLLSKLKRGDSSAFATIFTSYYSDLVSFASRFTHDLIISEEIVQDFFVTFWENHESICINVSLRSYMLKTIQNKCIDWYRHERIKQLHSKTILEMPSQVVTDTDSYLLYSELHEKVEATLNNLPDQISESYRLNRNKGLKYQEIADLLGVSVRTIEVRIGRALYMLRENLRDYFILVLVLFLIQF